MKPETRKNAGPVERVEEIYVAVFPIPVPGEAASTETVLAGFQKDPDNPGKNRVRATVETSALAVPDLVEMCYSIIENQDELDSFRLLKFDGNGITELNPKRFREEQGLTFYRNNYSEGSGGHRIC